MRKAFSIALSCLVLMATLVHCMTVSESSWAAFKQTFSKKYNSPKEEVNRQRIWQANSAYIQRHNDEADLGLHTFRLGMNQYGDLELYEFQRLFNFSKRKVQTPLNSTKSDILTHSIPDSIDWRTRGYVTAVKDQGSCESGWAFAAIASLEAQQRNLTGKLVALSTQQLIDCSTNNGNNGCAGGDPYSTMYYMFDKMFIDTDEGYPYEARNGSCRFRWLRIGALVNGFELLRPYDERMLVESLANVGPIATLIDANHASFQFYKSGIYSEADCSQEDINHGVAIVGYGFENTSQNDTGAYYIIKNSFGETWGEEGYMRMARTGENLCGVATVPVYPFASFLF